MHSCTVCANVLKQKIGGANGWSRASFGAMRAVPLKDGLPMCIPALAGRLLSLNL